MGYGVWARVSEGCVYPGWQAAAAGPEVGVRGLVKPGVGGQVEARDGWTPVKESVLGHLWWHVARTGLGEARSSGSCAK